MYCQCICAGFWIDYCLFIFRVEDQSVRYVAEENITLVRGNPGKDLTALAGQYFKRWDRTNGVFVSNIRDEYPDE